MLHGVMSWYCDNRRAIQSASKIGFEGRTKHVDAKLKCTRKYVQNGVVELEYVPSVNQSADIFTKRLRKRAVMAFVDSVLSRKE